MSQGDTWLARVNWRREAIYPALAVAEISLITPWMLAFLFHDNRFPPEVAARATLAIVLGTLYLTRAMDALHVRTLIQRAVLLVIMLATILAALRLAVFTEPQWAGLALLRAPFIHLFSLSSLLPNELVVTLGVILLFWRGLRLAHRSLSTFDVMMGFQIGIVLLALFVLVNTLITGQDITIFVPSFFFCQLLAVGLTRVETMWQERGGRRSPFTGWWLGALVGSTAIVIGLAGGISAVVLGVGPDKLLRWLGPVLAIITLPIALILLPIIALLGMVAEALARVLGNFQWPVILQQFQLSGNLQTERRHHHPDCAARDCDHGPVWQGPGNDSGGVGGVDRSRLGHWTLARAARRRGRRGARIHLVEPDALEKTGRAIAEQIRPAQEPGRPGEPIRRKRTVHGLDYPPHLREHSAAGRVAGISAPGGAHAL